jgi:hypothetical protein
MRLAATDQTGNGERRDVNKHRKVDLWKQQEHNLTGRESWCRNMCATVGLFETTYEGLLKSEF